MAATARSGVCERQTRFQDRAKQHPSSKFDAWFDKNDPFHGGRKIYESPHLLPERLVRGGLENQLGLRGEVGTIHDQEPCSPHVDLHRRGLHRGRGHDRAGGLLRPTGGRVRGDRGVYCAPCDNAVQMREHASMARCIWTNEREFYFFHPPPLRNPTRLSAACCGTGIPGLKPVLVRAFIRA